MKCNASGSPANPSCSLFPESLLLSLLEKVYFLASILTERSAPSYPSVWIATLQSGAMEEDIKVASRYLPLENTVRLSYNNHRRLHSTSLGHGFHARSSKFTCRRGVCAFLYPPGVAKDLDSH
jgi:hypothetical protein